MRRPAPSNEPITEARLERALTYMAYVVMRHGAVYMPIFDRLERELLELRRTNASVEERLRRLAIVGSKNVQHNVQHLLDQQG